MFLKGGEDKRKQNFEDEDDTIYELDDLEELGDLDDFEIIDDFDDDTENFEELEDLNDEEDEDDDDGSTEMSMRNFEDFEDNAESFDELDDLSDEDIEMPMEDLEDFEDDTENFEELEDLSDEDIEMPMEDFEDFEEDAESFEELEDLSDEDVEMPMEDFEDFEDNAENFEELEDLSDEDVEIPMEDFEDFEDNMENFEELEDLSDEDVEMPMEDFEDFEDDAESFEELEDLNDEDVEMPMEDFEDFEEDTENFEELEDLSDEDVEMPMEDFEDFEEDAENFEELDDLSDEDIEMPMEDFEDFEEDAESFEESEDLNDEENEEFSKEQEEDYFEEDSETEELEEDVQESLEEPVAVDEELEEMEETQEEVDKENEEDAEETDESIEEDELSRLTSLRAEYIFLGLLLNNPKAISRYYFLYEDCHFATEELDNIYRIILFREGEQYASATAKAGYKLPLEADDTYHLQVQLKGMASEKNYDIEMVYTILKKLFILKKHYLLAPTKIVRDNILEIVNYELYNEMTVEEVESAIEQIGVTASLSQGRLTDDVTNFLLNEESTLVNGADLPFPILSSVFKGLRKGETFVYAMPSNSGKSRFTINIASYLAFVQNKKVLIISNEMSEEKMKLCLITTILNNRAYQKLHGQKISKTEGELLKLQFRPDKKKGVKVDKDGFILREKEETMEDYVARLNELSSEFQKTIATTEWLNEQIENSIYFIHITEHTNEDIRKIIMNYYYRENIEYIFYDTLKADTENIGDGNEVKKTATILSNLAQKFEIFIGSSMQLLESTTLPVNLNINDMSASRTVKEVLDTLCLMKQINPQTLSKYEFSKLEKAKEYQDLKVFDDPDVRYYVCVVDKNRAGAKPKLLFRLNLAYNTWEELGYVRLKQEFVEK